MARPSTANGTPSDSAANATHVICRRTSVDPDRYRTTSEAIVASTATSSTSTDPNSSGPPTGPSRPPSRVHRSTGAVPAGPGIVSVPTQAAAPAARTTGGSTRQRGAGTRPSGNSSSRNGIDVTATHHPRSPSVPSSGEAGPAPAIITAAHPNAAVLHGTA